MTKPPSPTIREVLAKAHRRLVLMAVVLAGALTMVPGLVLMRHYCLDNLALVARTASYTVEPAVVFGDREAIGEQIAGLADPASVREVVVRDARGAVLAHWVSPQSKAISASDDLIDRLLGITPIRIGIMHDGAPIGSIALRANSHILLDYVRMGVIVALCGLGIAAVATQMLARRLQEGVVAPLDRVADVAHAVRTERAFARRVPNSGLAEIDRFTSDFNALLIELQGWHTTITSEKDALAHSATHDSLTGLGNRLRFEQRLDHAISEARRGEHGFALVYFDANGFKQINDTHGHLMGDELLMAIAQRLRTSIRQGDDAFRLGGDEFAVLLAKADPAQATPVIARVNAAMAETLRLSNGSECPVSLSAGIAYFPQDGEDATALLRYADTAMYNDKYRGRAGKARLGRAAGL